MIISCFLQIIFRSWFSGMTTCNNEPLYLERIPWIIQTGIEIRYKKCISYVQCKTIKKNQCFKQQNSVSCGLILILFIVSLESTRTHVAKEYFCLIWWYEILRLASVDLHFNEHIQNSVTCIHFKEIVNCGVFSTIPLCVWHIEI